MTGRVKDPLKDDYQEYYCSTDNADFYSNHHVTDKQFSNNRKSLPDQVKTSG